MVTFALLNRALASRGSLPMDKPNERSLHVVPVPRIGGICIFGGVGVAAIFAGAPAPALSLLLALALLLAAVSFVDDLRGLPFSIRLLAHLAAAAVWAQWAIGTTDILLAGAAVIAIGWMTNVFNFMDGSDGLAGGMATIGFAAYALALAEAAPELATLCTATAAAAAAFLLFNFHPARAFMGDAGSVPLGFLAGAIGVLGWQRQYWSLWFPALVFAPFILDASVTLAKRGLRGERVWQAHREHYYQRLVRMGWGHRSTALAEYVAMIYCAAAALALNSMDVLPQWAALSGILLPMVLVMGWIDLRWLRFVKGSA